VTTTTKCPNCGDELRYVSIPCPDSRPMCLVMHRRPEPCKRCADEAKKYYVSPLARALMEEIARLNEVENLRARVAELEGKSFHSQWHTAEVKLLELRAEVAHWKTNHDNQVAIKREVLDRPDLGERAASVLALRAEVAALKARKVKLPPRAGANESAMNYGPVQMGFNSGLDACTYAIRAAGMEVES